MKAYPLLLLTLVGASLCPNYASTSVYAEAAETPSTIAITPTGLESCEVVSALNVEVSYSLTNPDPSKLSTEDYLPNNSVATYSLEGLGSINITEVSFSAKSPISNANFYIAYYLNDGDRVRQYSGFDTLAGKSTSDDYLDLIAPFEYPIENAEKFRFEIQMLAGSFYVQSLTVIYEESMDPFAKAMLSDLSCDASGVTPPSGEEWDAAREAFEALGAEEQGKYMNAEADPNGDVYQRVVAKYDYILSKYGTEKYVKFLGRDVKNNVVFTKLYNSFDIVAWTGLCIVGVAMIVFLLVARKRINN